MGPNFSNPDDDTLKAKLLESLMEEMDDRIAGQLKPKVNVEETLGLGKSNNEAGEPGQAVDPAGLPKVTEESNGDDLDEDPSVDPELRDLIRAKRGGK